MTLKKITFEKYLRDSIDHLSAENQLSEILLSFNKIVLKKHDYFVKQGSTCKYFCYIESGILQHAITAHGEEKTTYLALTNSCTSALKSFINQSS